MKLSGSMKLALQRLRDGGATVAKHIQARTLIALDGRGLVQPCKTGWRITAAGRQALKAQQ